MITNEDGSNRMNVFDFEVILKKKRVKESNTNTIVIIGSLNKLPQITNDKSRYNSIVMSNSYPQFVSLGFSNCMTKNKELDIRHTTRTGNTF